MDTPMQAPRQSLLILAGLLITVTLLGVTIPTHLADRLENVTWDWRVRSLPRPPFDPRIVHIDIDDTSLQQIGRWPWPRRDIGKLVRALREAGAYAVVLDIEFPEPQEKELRPLLRAMPDPLRRFRVVDNDRLLAESLSEGSTVVFLAATAKLAFATPPVPQPSPDVLKLAEAELRTTPEQVAEKLDLPYERAVRQLAAAKRIVIRRRLAQWLKGRDADALVMPQDAAAFLLGDAIRDLQPEEFAPIRSELTHLLGLRTMAETGGMKLPGTPEIRQLTPPVAVIGRAGDVVGLTMFAPNVHDFVVRSVPLAASHEGQTYPQLSFAVACKLLGVTPDQVEVVPGKHMTLTCGDGRQIVIPIDQHCQMLINWAQRSHDLRDRSRHIPIKDVAEIWKTQDEIDRNLANFHEKAEFKFFDPGEAAGPSGDPDDRLYFRYLLQLADREQIVREGGVAGWTTDPAKRAAQLEIVRKDIVKLKRLIAARETAHWEMIGFAAEEPLEDPDLTDAERDQILLARGLMETRSANEENARLIAAARQRLRGRVEGRVCFVGSVATGAADFVVTALTARTPGVLVHSNVLNTILSGKFIRTTPAWLAVVLPLFLGALTTVLAARLAPKWTLVYAVAAVGLWIAAAVGVWAAWDFWLPVAMPVLAFLIPWGGVIGLRTLISERRTRWISRKFGQYTSPALLRRLSEGQQLGLEGESRTLTVFISDLRGFTSLSERLGPTRIVKLLNQYFAAMTEQLFKHEATVSKYIGDGIFAFFNAPVDQADHALRACRAALDCQQALVDLRTRLEPEFADLLHMRIGVGTGPVVVGNCGSELKFDYTVIGDTVNVASRLESGNKHIGTKILINDEAAACAADEMLVRPLGGISVVGRKQPVAAHELICTLADADENLKALVAAFAEGLGYFMARQWKDAIGLFKRCLEIDPADQPARLYLDRAQTYRKTPPPKDWDGSLRLESK